MSRFTKLMRFEPKFRAAATELLKAIQHLSKILKDHETASGSRTRARKVADNAKFEVAVEAIACNLIALAATGRDSRLAIPRSNGIMWSGGTASKQVYGSHFLKVIELMSQLELIRESDRGYRVSATVKMLSTITPTNRLNEYLPLSPADWRLLKEIDDGPLILLKSHKVNGTAESRPVKDNARTRQLAREVSRINTRLREADIEIDGLTDHLTLGEDGYIIVPFRRSLRRIFNNSNWQEGGRLAGGFFMSMPRGERHRIRINGEPVREVDYAQLHPRLAYVRAHQSQPLGDLYDIVGDGLHREGWKRLLNAMLFSKGPLKNWPEETSQQFPKGMKLKVACDMIRKKHAPIADLFGTQLGFRLMKIESDLLIRVITDLAQEGCVCLPLHDAVIVGAPHVERAAEVMREAFEALTGTKFCAIVSIK